LQAKSREEAARCWGELITHHADRIIVAVVRSKLYGLRHRQEVEDVCSEARTELLERLLELTGDSDPDGITRFTDYAAVVAYHACDGYFRRIYPKRSNLKNRIRYLMENHPSLALWKSKGEMLTGFLVWRDQPRADSADKSLQHLIEAPGEWPFSNPAGHSDLVELVAAVFRHVGGPVELDRLVGLVAALWGVKDEQPTPHLPKPPKRQEIVDIIAYRFHLKKVWKEICELPPRQRAALLLNLKDAQGCSLIEFLPACGIATIREIAEALNIPPERFAALWSRLPLDDLMISQQLGIKRQQVINLRKCARERLARKVTDLPW
jgi:hypothetical protein